MALFAAIGHKGVWTLYCITIPNACGKDDLMLSSLYHLFPSYSLASTTVCMSVRHLWVCTSP